MTYDFIIIGSGHNGLACAAYLAKAGAKVLVVERAPRVGGAATPRKSRSRGSNTISARSFTPTFRSARSTATWSSSATV
jgi:phytoene dehydrogenase-like protein